MLLATLAPRPPPINPAWGDVMGQLSSESCNAYRAHVVGNAGFMRYFEEATPESELGNLNIGSRPARRKAGVRDIASMRAIPWIFAWTQSRSVLPAWLGVGEGLNSVISAGQLPVLREMYDTWPFFRSTLDLVEMILSKVDMRIQKSYEDKLCLCDETRAVGQTLREAYSKTCTAVLLVTRHAFLSEANPMLRRLIDARAPHINVLNLVQAEVLARLRAQPLSTPLRDALLVSINGIAAGMRNTG